MELTESYTLLDSVTSPEDPLGTVFCDSDILLIKLN